MAYTDPDTGVTRDKYGNEVTRDPAGTDPHSHPTTFWLWVVGIVLAAALALAAFNMNSTDENPITGPSATQPVGPKPTPPTP